MPPFMVNVCPGPHPLPDNMTLQEKVKVRRATILTGKCQLPSRGLRIIIEARKHFQIFK